jgi:predicted negative regulator of RcsB-dependent stress response
MIWSWLAGKLALIGGAIVAVAGFFFYAKRQGKKDEQNAEAVKSLEQAKEANEIDTEVHNLSQSELDARLQSSRRPPSN